MSRNCPIGTNSLRVTLVLAVAILLATAATAEVGNPGPEESNVGNKNIHVLHVRANVYMLVGAGCNITVQVGERYVIVVDTGLPAFTDEVIATIRTLSSLPIMFVANTTSDLDHTGGNAKLYQVGWALPNGVNTSQLKVLPGATIVASLNTVNRTQEPAGKMTAIGYGREGFKLYNNEPVVFYQMGKAHTDGDTAVLFRVSDVVSAGDIFMTTSYPVIENENGGSIDGFIDALNDLIELLVPRESEEGGTYVIPGHGHLSDRADVVNYRDMVTIIRGRIERMVEKGMPLEQVMAARPTLDYDGIYGVEGGRRFTEAVYRDLTKDTNRTGRK